MTVLVFPCDKLTTALHARFLDNKSDVEKVRQCFAGLWSLENDSIVMSAIESPELFVLKPQREGGGMAFIYKCGTQFLLWQQWLSNSDVIDREQYLW
jgi:hypothetical protein